MPLINQKNVLRLLKSYFPEDGSKSGVNFVEMNLVTALLSIIKDASEAATFDLILDTTLEFKESYEIAESKTEPMVIEASSSDETIDPSQPSTSRSDIPPLEYKQRAVAYWRSYRPGWHNQKIDRSLSAVQGKFSLVQNIRQLQTWASEISGMETVEKSEKINVKVLDKFAEEASVNTIIKDKDVQAWARKKNMKIGLEGFQASRTWLQDFKNTNEIVRRKVYKFVIRSKESIVTHYFDEAHLYRRLIRQRLEKLAFCELFHIADYQFSPKFSIVLIINGEGRLLSPLTVVIKDATKTAADLAAEAEQANPNLRVITGRFNTLTPRPFVRWFKKEFLPVASKTSCLVVNETLVPVPEQVVSSVTEPQQVMVEVIPTGAEFLLEPMREVFKIWRLLVKAIDDYIDVHHEHELDRSSTVNVLKIQAFVHHQLVAEQYGNLFMDAWRRSGFLDVDNLGSEGLDPVIFAFGRDSWEDNCQACGRESFVKCAHCSVLLCFQHALMIDGSPGFHFHRD